MANPNSMFRCGHRERLRQKFLDGNLADYEKLELMLGYVVPRRDMRPLAHALIKRFGSLARVISAPMDELLLVPGVGRNIAIFLKLVHDMVLIGYRDAMGNCPIFYDINLLKNYCKWAYADKPVEEIHVLYLDGDYRLLQDELHNSGTCNAASLYVREIVRHALKLNSTGVVLVHNHPASDSTFSSQDIDTTAEVKKLFDGLGIKLYDHLLVSKHSIYSARDVGLLRD